MWALLQAGGTDLFKELNVVLSPGLGRPGRSRPLRHDKQILIRSRCPHESGGVSPVPRVGSTTHDDLGEGRGGTDESAEVPPCPMVPFCDVVRRAAATMESGDDRRWPVHRRHHRDQCEVQDVGPSDPDDPPQSAQNRRPPSETAPGKSSRLQLCNFVPQFGRLRSAQVDRATWPRTTAGLRTHTMRWWK